MEKDKEKTKVVFRRWEGSIIALFPELPADYSGYLCESYEHIGQHGAADAWGIVARSRPVKANDPDVLELVEELENIGYNLDIRQKCTATMRGTRQFRAKCYK